MDREALRLVLWDELSHAEAAKVLECTTNAFEIRYRRARNVVRDLVEDAGDGAKSYVQVDESIPDKGAFQ